MEVTERFGAKVYNLSAGKSLPEWISDRKKRTLLKNDVGLRRRIELIQDFTMPVAATGIDVSADGQYIFATGIYKPRVRCYDVSHLSMKFERCIDAEVVGLALLSENYTKFVMLLANRQLEFHSQFGFYYRTRIPKFGRSLAYHTGSCDLYVTADGPEIYRLNLEEGKFMSPLVTKASGCNTCQFNPHHQLLAAGTDEGTVECWDPRSHCRVGELLLAMGGLQCFESDVVPAVTALAYRDAMKLAVGTASGQVLLYDLRSPRPYRVKEHANSPSPINSIAFQAEEDLVLSANAETIKIWNENDGSNFTSIEPDHRIHQVRHLQDTGMLLVAVDDPKMLAYYIPSMGVAPKWCSFLDNLTEELEEDPEPTVYQDYKFVSKEDLDGLGLSHLVGTNLLRAYMHGYFMDMALYHKAKAVAQPFAYEEYRKEKIRKKIEESKASRIRLKELPKVNRKLAERLSSTAKKGGVAGKGDVLEDSRFSAMFTNPEFEVDEESDEFQRLHPVLSHREKKKQGKEVAAAQEDEELEGRPSDVESSSDESDPEVWREVRREVRERRELARQATNTLSRKALPVPVSVAAPVKATPFKLKTASSKVSLGQRLEKVKGHEEAEPSTSLGSKEHTFTMHKTDPAAEERRKQLKEHGAERRKVRRSATSILPKKKSNQPVYWRGRRVK